jgi:hypothetical protein
MTRQGTVKHRSELTNESDYSLVMTYQLEYRGLVNYYRLAYNLHTLNRAKWVMEESLTKTLARKHKVSVKAIYDRYRTEIMVNGTTYRGLQVTVPREGREPLIATWGGIPLKWDIRASLEEQPTRVWRGRTELEKRLLAQICELCGATGSIQVHHIRAMKDLTPYTGREKPYWVRRMAELRRKTMALCQSCHEDVHAGRSPRRKPIKLMDVKRLQQAGTRRY